MKVAQILADPQYSRLKSYVIEHTGLEYYTDKDEDFAARIGRRLAAREIAMLGVYLELLRSHKEGLAEMEALVGELTIGETYFFRQAEHFEMLRKRIVPELLERNRATRTLRIWSAGCAIGAEPYSISILLRLHVAAELEGWDVSIVGTDINREFLTRAEVGRYGAWAFRATAEDVRQRCFEREGNQWVIRPEFRDRVSFRVFNLASQEGGPGGEQFDIILCRNVMIYFGREATRRVISNFHGVLREGGWLLVGHAEPNLETFARFQTVCVEGGTAYRKTAEPSAAVLAAKPSPDSSLPPIRGASARRPAITPTLPPRQPSSPRFSACAPAPRVEDARAMADRGEWSAAESLCRALIAADSLNAAAHFTLGLVLEHRGDAGEAERTLRRTIYLDRGFALAHYHLGICLQQGSPVRAHRSFENVLQMLQARPDDEIVEHGDGITVKELRELAKMHLELLGKR